MNQRIILSATLALFTLSSVALAGPYKEVEVKDGGTITGVVNFTGKVPPAKTVSKDTEACGTSTPDANIHAKEGKLENAVVWLKKVKAGKPFTPAQKSVVSDQHACVFVPHVSLVAEGGKVEFKNSDKVLHNVKSTSLKNPAFNEGVEGGKSITKEFKKGHEGIQVSCSVHDWMISYVYVMPHPYYAVTNDKGEFTLSDVPPGKYKLVVFHGQLKKECTVKVDGKGDAKQPKGGVKIEVGKGATVKIEASFGG